MPLLYTCVLGDILNNLTEKVSHQLGEEDKRPARQEAPGVKLALRAGLDEREIRQARGGPIGDGRENSHLQPSELEHKLESPHHVVSEADHGYYLSRNTRVGRRERFKDHA